MTTWRWSLLALAGVLPLTGLANDFPTDARVRYVVECMAKHGGPDFGRLYQCSCSVDHLASALTYDSYVEADTYLRGAHAAGERGGILREGPRARELRAKLGALEAQAERKCFPGTGGQVSSKK